MRRICLLSLSFKGLITFPVLAATCSDMKFRWIPVLSEALARVSLAAQKYRVMILVVPISEEIPCQWTGYVEFVLFFNRLATAYEYSWASH